MKIHDTAVIASSAEFGEDVEIGPYSVIDDNVQVGDGTRIGPHCYIAAGCRLGKRNALTAFVSLGSGAQDLKFHGAEALLVIGDDNVFREYVSINRGTPKEDSLTRIGDRNFFMACSHVGHDSSIGNNVVLTNGVLVGGHCHIADFAVFNGMSGLHQFASVGRAAYVGAQSRVIQDVPPFLKVSGDPAEVRSVNEIGMQRAGIGPEDVAEIKHVYRAIFRRGSSVTEEAHNLINDDSPLVRELADFLLRKEAGRYGRYRESLRGH